MRSLMKLPLVPMLDLVDALTDDPDDVGDDPRRLRLVVPVAHLLDHRQQRVAKPSRAASAGNPIDGSISSASR